LASNYSADTIIFIAYAFDVKILVMMMNSKTLGLRQISKKLVVILIDLSIPPSWNGINQYKLI